jgi:hypothetical protein
MSKSFKFNPLDQQSDKYSKASKKAKLTKQQAGRVEKALLRNSGSDKD